MMLDELIFQMMFWVEEGVWALVHQRRNWPQIGLPMVMEERVENVDGGIQENVHQDITCAVKGVPGTQHLSPHCGCASVSSWEDRESSITNRWGLLGAQQ